MFALLFIAPQPTRKEEILMNAFPNSPRLLKGGLVLVDPDSGTVQRIIVLQYNPDSLSRTLQAQTVRPETRDRSEALRLTGPAIETLKLEAEIDATDQLEFPDRNPTAAQPGSHQKLARSLGTISASYRSTQLLTNNSLAQSGVLEIAPMEVAAQPVRVEQEPHYSGSHHRFQHYRRSVSIRRLIPSDAKVSLGMRVLNVNDLGFDDKGGNLFMAYLQQKELFSGLADRKSRRARPGEHLMSPPSLQTLFLQFAPGREGQPVSGQYKQARSTGPATRPCFSGQTIVYLKRRFVPSPDRLSIIQQHTVLQGERLDNLASQFLGDPELYWRLCDANAAMRPEDLEVAGFVMQIALPEGLPGT